MPPLWASLHSDPILYPRADPAALLPDSIKLGNQARCVCGAVILSPLGQPIIRRLCLVYTLARAFPCQVELVHCPKSCSSGRPRLAGPDGRELGLFNYNNQILISHDLLDEYTMAYTSSETPFVAWVGTISTRYKNYSPNGPYFINEDTFRTAWFLYSSLIAFDGDMRCHVCGPEPTAIIFDGVTLAFGKKHLTSSLRPPTTIYPQSAQRPSKYITNQAIIKNRPLRQTLQKVVTGKSLVLTEADLSSTNLEMDNNSDWDSDDEASLPRGSVAEKSKLVDEAIVRLNLIPSVHEGLSKINLDLGRTFHQYCGLGRLSANLKPPSVYISLFKEVSMVLHPSAYAYVHPDLCRRVRSANDTISILNGA